jgi:hypothetical protein
LKHRIIVAETVKVRVTRSTNGAETVYFILKRSLVLRTGVTVPGLCLDDVVPVFVCCHCLGRKGWQWSIPIVVWERLRRDDAALIFSAAARRTEPLEACELGQSACLTRPVVTGLRQIMIPSDYEVSHLTGADGVVHFSVVIDIPPGSVRVLSMDSREWTKV